MTHPVAPYLIAIAAGDIAFQRARAAHRRLGRAGDVDRAAAELVDTEKMVDAAEQLYGPYRWGRYDVIVLPPAFPYGGMEIRPSPSSRRPSSPATAAWSARRARTGALWSGNLVTNAVWPDSWLNEGFTSYIEGRIGEAVFGSARAAQGRRSPGPTCRRA